mgnify:CR=1 FL=1
MGDNVHVLVVDDNRMNIRLIERILMGYDIKVTTALSGKEALEKIQSADYNFVFMDHMMPELDGVETMHCIRNMVGEYYKNIPIIALTANVAEGTREMLIEEGFDDFLEKPLEKQSLEKILKKYSSLGQVAGNGDGDRQKDVEDICDFSKLEIFLTTIGIDFSKGIIYCNGKDNYYNILKGFCNDCSETGKVVQAEFERRDWKNYTIAVHGIKGAMRSIGAVGIGELAAQLETAGKEGRRDFILTHHDAMLKEYYELFDKLSKCELIGYKENVLKKEECLNLPNLEKSVFEQMLYDMELAVYELNEEKLLNIVAELQKFQYCNVALNDVLEPVNRKIKMLDYMSATELAGKIKNKIENQII